jgi:hypothetical protein
MRTTPGSSLNSARTEFSQSCHESAISCTEKWRSSAGPPFLELAAGARSVSTGEVSIISLQEKSREIKPALNGDEQQIARWVFCSAERPPSQKLLLTGFGKRVRNDP